MATKSIAWQTGNGNITLTYQGQGDGTIIVESDANTLGSARSQVINIETVGGAVTKNLTVNQAACPFPVGAVRNYSYSGSYQEVELPAGQYMLQCWGAQGGRGQQASILSVYNTISGYYINGSGGIESTGGYSIKVYDVSSLIAGECVLKTGTTPGQLGLTSDAIWCTNADGSGVQKIEPFSAASNHVYTKPSEANYLLVISYDSISEHYARVYNAQYIGNISAFQGNELNLYSTLSDKYINTSGEFSSASGYVVKVYNVSSLSTGDTVYKVGTTPGGSSIVKDAIWCTNADGSGVLKIESFTSADRNTYIKPSGANYLLISTYGNVRQNGIAYASGSVSETDNGYVGGKGGYSEGILTLSQKMSLYIFVGGQGLASGNGGWNGGGGSSGLSIEQDGYSIMNCGGGSTDMALVPSSMNYSSYRTNRISASLLSRIIVAGGGSGASFGLRKDNLGVINILTQAGFAGGGTTGAGYSSTYQGKQNGAGSNGSFGQGANQTATNYRYCSGAGGGGWYGGGMNYSDSDMNACQMSGGGSGFVNTAANAGNRPSGYTGLELDSGTTAAGNTSFEAPGGGTETGHAGNGYARITRLS